MVDALYAAHGHTDGCHVGGDHHLSGARGADDPGRWRPGYARHIAPDAQNGPADASEATETTGVSSGGLNRTSEPARDLGFEKATIAGLIQ